MNLGRNKDVIETELYTVPKAAELTLQDDWRKVRRVGIMSNSKAAIRKTTRDPKARQ